MGFYFISVFSIVLLTVVYGLLLLVFWGIARLTRGVPGRKVLLTVVGAVFLALPVAEEFWIAWNFGQACKEAGTFIYKKVQVEGFYDDTTGWGPRQLSESKYKFMESRDILNRKLLRVEPTDNAARDRALAWYDERIRQKQPVRGPYVVQPISDKEQIVVAPNRIDAWRVTTIDHPTAKYHFRHTDPMNGTPWAHKVIRTGSVVIDSANNEMTARYTSFGRGPPWFFIGLDVPGYACDLPGDWPYTRKSRLIYREALIPVGQR